MRVIDNNDTNEQPTGPTGPRTPEGKAISAMNALKHGLASGALIIKGEDPAEFEALKAGLEKDFQPANTIESTLVANLAKSQWLTDRAIRLQQLAWEARSFDQWLAAPVELSVLIRYQNTNHHAFITTLKTLQVIQKERKLAEKSEKEFVSQTPQKPVMKISQMDLEPHKRHPHYPLFLAHKGITDPNAKIDLDEFADFLLKLA
jgi:hypothetical protein